MSDIKYKSQIDITLDTYLDTLELEALMQNAIKPGEGWMNRFVQRTTNGNTFERGDAGSWLFGRIRCFLSLFFETITKASTDLLR
jgi:hypothetical protein